MNTELKENQRGDLASPEETTDRRELIRKLGKFAVYAAPFTILATTSKAASTSFTPSSTPARK
jgi:hypothetical protein